METAQLEKITKGLQERLSEALSSLTRQEVKFSLEKISVLPVTDIHKLVDNTTDSTTTVYVPIMGDVIGDIFVFIPAASATHLADLMIGNPIGTTEVMSDFENSALKELGNITTGVIVTEIANVLDLSMMLTVPNLATDMAGALLDQVMIEYGENSVNLLALDFPFAIEAIEAQGKFLILFNQEASDIISAKLKKD